MFTAPAMTPLTDHLRSLRVKHAVRKACTIASLACTSGHADLDVQEESRYSS
jgi:hypothetical protein